MPVTPQITVTGNLDDIFGAPDLNASVVIQLCGFGANIPRIVGTALIAKTLPIAVAAPAGSFSVLLWGNDVITPGPLITYYTFTIVDDQGNVIATAGYQLSGSGTQDLSTLTPYIPAVLSPAPPNAVITNPPGAGTQTINGSIHITGNLIVDGSISPPPIASYVSTTFSATPVFTNPLAGSVVFDITLTGNVTSSSFGGITIPQGAIVTFFIVQDGTGSRTFVWPTNVKGGAIIDGTPNAINTQTFQMRSDGNLYPIGPLTVS